MLLRYTTGTITKKMRRRLLQFTVVFSFFRQLFLQYTTGITNFHERSYNSRQYKSSPEEHTPFCGVGRARFAAGETKAGKGLSHANSPCRKTSFAAHSYLLCPNVQQNISLCLLCSECCDNLMRKSDWRRDGPVQTAKSLLRLHDEILFRTYKRKLTVRVLNLENKPYPFRNSRLL